MLDNKVSAPTFHALQLLISDKVSLLRPKQCIFSASQFWILCFAKHGRGARSVVPSFSFTTTIRVMYLRRNMERPAPDLPSLWLVLRNKAGCPESLFVYSNDSVCARWSSPLHIRIFTSRYTLAGIPTEEEREWGGWGLRHENTDQTSRSLFLDGDSQTLLRSLPKIVLPNMFTTQI